jgi:hypothetical protein
MAKLSAKKPSPFSTNGKKATPSDKAAVAGPPPKSATSKAPPRPKAAQLNPLDADADDDAAAHLSEAISNPGVAEIPEAEMAAGPVRVTSIPAVDLDPDAGDAGEPLAVDPALLTVEIDRPGPHTWLRLSPKRTLRTVLLAHKATRDSSPTYYYVIPALQQPLVGDLKQVNAMLVYDGAAGGGAFFWIVPETPMSPYFVAIQSALAKGPDFIAQHEFRFEYRKQRGGRGTVAVRVRTVPAGSPAPVLPTRSTSVLLAEALRDHIISDVSHPVYRSLTAGVQM